MWRHLIAAAILVLANDAESSIIQPHVLGGDHTTIESYPYMVSVQVLDTHVCGGAILSQKHFITAGLCLTVLPDLPINNKVRVGSPFSGKGGNLLKVSDIVHHPDYKPFQYDYDVAIGKFEKPIEFSFVAQPIGLVDVNEQSQAGDMFTTSGWGSTTKGDDKNADVLHAVRVMFVDTIECRAFYKREDVDYEKYTWTGVNDTLRCAGGNGYTLHKSDAGAPLVNSKKQLIGVATRPQELLNIRWPALYANLAHPSIHHFVTENIK